jgi:hypothetical protein
MDERTIELIHGDIDGELDAAQRVELGRILEASAEARSEHARLRALSTMMAGLPECAPPPGLRDSILAKARPPARAARRLPVRKRTGLGLAAALAATVVGIAVFIGQHPEFAELDASALAGTLGRPLVDGPPPSMRLDGDVVSGTIILHRGKEGLALEVDLNASKPVEIVAAAGRARLNLQGFVRVDGAPSGMDGEEGTVRVSHAGRQHYVLVLASDDAPEAIELAVFDGQELIQKTRLEGPAGPSVDPGT